MKIGMVGLGKMGANMAKRLIQHGHEVVGFAPGEDSRKEHVKNGGIEAQSLEDLVSNLSVPRTIWLMVPAGKITDQTVNRLGDLLAEDDTVIDGGNSFYKDSVRHGEELIGNGIHFLDVGTSGGIWGLKKGYSLMIGGEDAVVKRHQKIFEDLAPAADRGWGHVGTSGAGHFVKMVHNGIEYGMMQAYAEGYEILNAKKEYDLNLYQISEIWRFGTVIRSWLLDLIADGLKGDQELASISPWVADSGEGRWTVQEAMDLDIPAPIITLSLQRRFRSRQEDFYADKLLALIRNQFGGHAIKKEGEK